VAFKKQHDSCNYSARTEPQAMQTQQRIGLSALLSRTLIFEELFFKKRFFQGRLAQEPFSQRLRSLAFRARILFALALFALVLCSQFPLMAHSLPHSPLFNHSTTSPASEAAPPSTRNDIPAITAALAASSNQSIACPAQSALSVLTSPEQMLALQQRLTHLILTQRTGKLRGFFNGRGKHSEALTSELIIQWQPRPALGRGEVQLTSDISLRWDHSQGQLPIVTVSFANNELISARVKQHPQQPDQLMFAVTLVDAGNAGLYASYQLLDKSMIAGHPLRHWQDKTALGNQPSCSELMSQLQPLR